MSIQDVITKHRSEILALAEQHGAERIRLFGSLARGEETQGSDIDVLVAFEPGRSLLDQIALRQDLESLLGLPVDVVSEEGISPYLATTILNEATPL